MPRAPGLLLQPLTRRRLRPRCPRAAPRSAPPPRAAKAKDAGGGGGAAAAGATLAPGRLVAFTKDGRTLLGLVTEPDGKSKWFVTDARGKRASVAPKAVALALPGSFGVPDLERFAAAAAGADASLLEIAWSIAAEDGGGGGGGGGGTVGMPLALADLAGLLFDGGGALELWQTFSLLARDRVFFKQAVRPARVPCARVRLWRHVSALVHETRAPARTRRARPTARQVSKSGALAYQARSPDAVAAAQQQLEAEAAAEADRAAWVDAAAAAAAAAPGSKPGPDAWEAGPHAARVRALREFAVRGDRDCSAAALEAARAALALLPVKAEPPAAWGLLADIGAAERHAPLPLLRAGVSMSFDPALEAAAQVRPTRLLAEPA